MVNSKRAYLRTYGCVCAIVSLRVSQAADYSGFPAFKEGEWEVTNTIQLKGKAPEKGGTSTYDCFNPAEAIKQEIAMLEKSGCTASPITRVDREYQYSLICGAGRTNRYTLKTQRTDEFVHITFSEGDTSTDTGRRIGECKREPNKVLKKDAR